MRFGDSSLGFGGWDKGIWGLGWDLVGDNLDEIGGQPFRFWGLGQGDLGFRGGTWLGTTLMRFGGQPFWFWGLGQGDFLSSLFYLLFPAAFLSSLSRPTHLTASVSEHLA